MRVMPRKNDRETRIIEIPFHMEVIDFLSRNITRRTEDGAAREMATRLFHSFRHTFTSMMAKGKVTEKIRTKRTGHAESSTHQIHTHLETETLWEAIGRIPHLA